MNHNSKTSTHHVTVFPILMRRSFNITNVLIRFCDKNCLTPLCCISSYCDIKTCENMLEHTTMTADFCFTITKGLWKRLPASKLEVASVFCSTQTSPSAYLFTAGGTRLRGLALRLLPNVWEVPHFLANKNKHDYLTVLWKLHHSLISSDATKLNQHLS